ncbi:MAG: DegV family protein [Peptoniphilaceae bacterium]|nr:DegV family protein [Peptoniphilaceae bacterium]MDY6086161.1 DegV family protein [Peptoniphilaceae bacterium]
MAIRIIIDSSSDYLKPEAEAMGMKFIPLSVSFGERSFRDGIDLSKDAFYEKLEVSREPAMTSQPTRPDIEAVYREVVEAGDAGIVLTLASDLSGTYHHCAMVAKEFEGKIAVVDSGNATLGMQLIAEKALDLVSAGADVADVIATIEEHKKRVYSAATLDTLEYLKRGGRISPAMQMLAGLLSVKPVVMLHENTFELAGKGRGRKNAFRVLRDFFAQKPGAEGASLRVAYTGTSPEPAEAFLAQFPELEPGARPLRQVGPILGTHLGPGCVVLSFFADPVE